MTSLHRPSSTSSTPDSAASAKGALADNSQLDVLSRKRTLGEHLGSNSHSQSGNKSRRTSPSPHATRSTTPSTSSGGDFPQLEDGFFDLTGFVSPFLSHFQWLLLIRSQSFTDLSLV